MKKIIITLALLALSACGTSSPIYSPPQPQAPSRPGVSVLEANFNDLRIGFGCGGSPFSCAALPVDKNWSALPPGASGGRDCSLPLPNECFSVTNGVLNFTTPNDGMALISALGLDPTRPMSIEEDIRIDTIDCSKVSYTGPVDYGGGVDDGDPTGNYKAWYFSCFGGDRQIKMWLYTPVWAGPVYDGPLTLGVTYTFGLDWYPNDRVDYKLNGAIVYSETFANTHASLAVTNTPHPSMWFGGVTGAVLRYSVRN